MKAPLANTRQLTQPGHFVLGLFAMNCSGGLAATQVEERWPASWEEILETALLADRAGLDFLLPLARWRGYGGATDFQGRNFETITWATGLLAATQRITVFATVHAPLMHPVILAKQLVTADHIGRGRAGLNIVCGWNDDEFDMFGLHQREHDDRYAYGQEWWNVVSGLWASEKPFDREGKYLRLKGLVAEPKPWGTGRPFLMSAGASAAGRAFGARNCDVLFTILVDKATGTKDVTTIKAQATAEGRAVDVVTTSHVVCRPTAKEATDYYEHYVDRHGDWTAAERLQGLLMKNQNMQGRPPEVIKRQLRRFVAGHGTYPIVGDPDGVAAEIADIAKAGFSGSTISFVNYKNELPYFCAEVLPRLERLGVRQAVKVD